MTVVEFLRTPILKNNCERLLLHSCENSMLIIVSISLVRSVPYKFMQLFTNNWLKDNYNRYITQYLTK